MNTFRKIEVWIRRFRHRKGYGVQSPSAFDFICSVINESGNYYAYEELKPLRKGQRRLDENVDKLLFRLSNHVQPKTLVQVSSAYPLSLKYLQAGCKKANVLCLEENEMNKLKQILEGNSLDFLHLPAVPNGQEWFSLALEHVTERSLFVIQGIYASKERSLWWKQIQQHPIVGRTYDLYQVGVICFDHSKVKEHYIVNFI